MHKETERMTTSRTRTAIVIFAISAGALLAFAGPASATLLYTLHGSFNGHEAPPASEFSPAGLAVDNSCAEHVPPLTGSTIPTCAEYDASAGKVYVSDYTHKRIDRFKEEPSGSATYVYDCQITGEGANNPSPPGSECDVNSSLTENPPVPSGAPGERLGYATSETAVDSSGNLFYPEGLGNEIDEFNALGTWLSPQITPGGSQLYAVALDASNNLYVASFGNSTVYKCGGSSCSPFASVMHVNGVAVDRASGDVYATGGNVVEVFDSSGNHKATIESTGPGEPLGQPYRDAVDPVNGNLFVIDRTNKVVDQFDSTGNFVSHIPVPGASAYPFAVAVNATNHLLYVANLSEHVVDIYEPYVVPTTIAGAATEVKETEASLHGEVDPEIAEGGSPVESCQFEYLTEAEFQSNPSNERFKGAKTASCLPAASATSPYTAKTAVGAGLTGLAPSTTYHFRLEAVNANALSSYSVGKALTTPGAAAISAERSNARPTGATVFAQINPYGYATTCEVQFLTEAEYNANPPSEPFEGAGSTPCAEATIPAGFGNQPDRANLPELVIGTIYRYRFVAHNGATAHGGTSEGAAASFSTFRIESLSVKLENEAGGPFTEAGGHPYELRVNFTLSTTERESPLASGENVVGNIETTKVKLPPGLIGNPAATPTCTAGELKHHECAPEAAVGYMVVTPNVGGAPHGPLYNIEPPRGVAADFGAQFKEYPSVHIESGVRTGSDYGIDSDSVKVSAEEGVSAVEVRIWGVPADPSHTSERFCRSSENEVCPSTAPLLPLLRLPTSCSGEPLNVTLAADAWQAPGVFTTASTELEPVTGCDGLQFEPSLEARPTTNVADAPSGLNVDLHVPQESEPCEAGPPVECNPAVADLKDARVVLPKGMTLNPAGANGLAGCTPAEIELHGPEAAKCPDSAKVGTVEVISPLLKEHNEQGEPTSPHPLPGAVYVATPFDNPFHSLLAIYIAVHDPKSGVVIKLAGHVELDPETGQITTTFDENPQLPFEHFRLHFFEGAFAPLRTPPACGHYSITSVLTPWSAPESGSPAEPSDSYEIGEGANGGACVASEAAEPNQPSFEAGTIAPVAAAYSPLVLHLRREDGTQQLSKLTVTPPPGLVGKLAGIPYCPQSGIDRAKSREHPGGGAEEQANPSCPAASHVGVVNVSAGAGPSPYWVQGQAYLAGPYKGAPLSMVIVTPATAGPFDLGVVVTRVALQVNSETTQITAEADPIPQIIEGIPLDVRSVNVRLDREGFTRNPTSCEAMAVSGEELSTLGQAAALSSRFQVGGCGALGFKPRLALRLRGGIRRGAHPALRAVVRMPAGGANVARAAVAMPHSEFLDQGHIRTVCTRVQFAAHKCPKAAIYGHAVARSPLLGYALRGPVYLRSSSHKLPDMVAVLRGPAYQPIEIDLDGRIDSVNGGIRTVFQSVPDAPVSSFVLSMQGGRKGLLVNSTDICEGAHRANANFRGQNGKAANLHPPLRNGACARARRRHRSRSRRR